VQETASKSYGIRIHKVGLKQLGLPADNIPEIFDRMRAEREKVAARHKAEGEKEASRIRSDTDFPVDAGGLGLGIYREAHSKDPEFYKFLRRIDSLKVLFGEQTSLTLVADQAPFDLLKMSTPGKSGKKNDG